MDFIISEVPAVVAELQQDRVCHCLSRQGCSSSTECDRDLQPPRNGQNAGDFLLRRNLDHHLGVQPATVGAPSETVQVKPPEP